MNHCPECEDALLPGATRCSCGWRSKAAKSENRSSEPRPDTESLIRDLIEILTATDKAKWPVAMPDEPQAAAEWFLWLIADQRPGEQQRQHMNRDGKYYWRWPYADRARGMLHTFLRGDADLQRLVIAAREDEIFWRGEDYRTLLSIINETEAMREEGVTDYVARARLVVRNALLERRKRNA